jgi:hypothetical protein
MPGVESKIIHKVQNYFSYWTTVSGMMSFAVE